MIRAFGSTLALKRKTKRAYRQNTKGTVCVAKEDKGTALLKRKTKQLYYYEERQRGNIIKKKSEESLKRDERGHLPKMQNKERGKSRCRRDRKWQ